MFTGLNGAGVIYVITDTVCDHVILYSPLFCNGIPGWTGYITSAALGNDEVVRAFTKDFIKHGNQFLMNPISDDLHGGNALHWACMKGHLNIVQELVKGGFNIHCRAYNSDTALSIASR